MSAIPQQKQAHTRKNTYTRISLPNRPANLDEANSVESSQRAEPAEAVEPILYRAANLSKFVTLSATKSLYFFAKKLFRYLRLHPIHAFSSALLLLILVVLTVTGSRIHEDIILSEISSNTVDDIVKSSSYTRDFNLVQVGKRGSVEFTGVGAPLWSQREAARAVLFHARKAGLSLEDQAVLLATVEVESGFNPSAKAPTTTACGLFQFVRATGQQFGLSQTDCMNPWLNAQAGVAHYIKNYNKSVKLKVSHLEGSQKVLKTFVLSYYLHHDGPNSTNPSNDVKATILNGSDFLFKVYDVLSNESESKRQAPNFLDEFSQNFLEIIHGISAYLTDDTGLQVAGKILPQPES